IEVQILPQPNFKAIEDRFGLMNQAKMLFGLKRSPILFRLGEDKPFQDAKLQNAIHAMRRGDVTTRDLDSASLGNLSEEVKEDWAAYLRVIVENARDYCRSQFDAEHEEAFKSELKQMREHLKKLREDDPEEAREFAADIDCMKVALMEWEPVIDTIG